MERDDDPGADGGRPRARRLRQVPVSPLDVDRLGAIVGPRRIDDFRRTAAAMRALLDGRAIFNVSSTAAGGGVAEMLQSLLAYVRGAGVDARWLVIGGEPEFFAITKRIHNGLYGGPGDGGPLGDGERARYERVLRRNAAELEAQVRRGDVVIVHDPQPAGLAAAARRAGALVVWRSHVGAERPNAWTERAWSFLRPYLDAADAFVVSRASFAPPWAEPGRVHAIPPSIDPFAAKNAPLDDAQVRGGLVCAGLLDGPAGAPPAFVHRDGSPGRVADRADLLGTGPAPAQAPLVVQVSRWDAMKDMAGVMEGFAAHVDAALGAHLLLVGPAAGGVADDPEAAGVLDACRRRREQLPPAIRARVHLACMPMDDPDEQATIVNAIQRHATVVVQKSLAEGFGLTVTEAMWKRRPVIASAVGGIRDQIDDGRQGILLPDPADLPAFGAAVERLLRDRDEARRLAAGAYERVVDRFLGDRHLERWAALAAALVGDARPPARHAI